MTDKTNDFMTKALEGGKKRPRVNPEEIYTKLVIYPHKRRQMYTYVSLAFCFFLSLIFKNTFASQNWLVILGPCLILGLVVCLIPTSEEWEYRAWQSQPRQIERHQVERK